MHCRTALLLISLCGPVVAQPPADIPNLSVPFTVLLQGSPVSAPVVNAMEREVESLLAHAAFAIPAVRGVEFGTGFAAARMFGSQHNDAIEDMQGRTRTNHAGGVVGGLSNGNELVFRLAIKPTSSTPKEQQTLNWETGQQERFSVKGRHDLCVALRAPVIVEAVTAIVLADLFLLEQRVPRVVRAGL